MRHVFTNIRTKLTNHFSFLQSHNYRKTKIVIVLLCFVAALLFIQLNPLALPDWMPQLKKQEAPVTPNNAAVSTSENELQDVPQAIASQNESDITSQTQMVLEQISTIMDGPYSLLLQYADKTFYIVQNPESGMYLSITENGQIHEYYATLSSFKAKYDGKWGSLHQGDAMFDYITEYEDALDFIQSTFYYMPEDQLEGEYLFENIKCTYSIQQQNHDVSIEHNSIQPNLTYHAYIHELPAFNIEDFVAPEN